MGQSSCSPVRSPYLAGDQLFLLRPEHHRAPAETVGRATNADRIVKMEGGLRQTIQLKSAYCGAIQGWVMSEIVGPFNGEQERLAGKPIIQDGHKCKQG